MCAYDIDVFLYMYVHKLIYESLSIYIYVHRCADGYRSTATRHDLSG